MSRAIFYDQQLESEFREKGYVIVPLLERKQVNELYDYYHRTKPPIKKGFHSTSTVNDLDYRKEVNQVIGSLFTPAAEQLIKDYEQVFASFVIKEPGIEGNFPFHMDWSMVDESKHVSVAFWAPLVDTDDQNGTLEVLEKSHTLGLSYRGGPFLFQSLAEDRMSGIHFTAKRLYIKAGEAVIYDHRLFHGSAPNLTGNTRPALNFTMKPKEAKLIHYHLLDHTIKCFDIDKDFFLYYKMGDFPEGYPESDIIAGIGLLLNDQLIYKLIQ